MYMYSGSYENIGREEGGRKAFLWDVVCCWAGFVQGRKIRQRWEEPPKCRLEPGTNAVYLWLDVT